MGNVGLTQESVQVAPGESTEIGITVRNDSNVVDVLSIEIEGLDPSWFRLSVAQSSLFPGDQTSGTLTLTPPKTSDSVARTYPFTVKTTSQKDPTQSTVLTVNLQIQPFHSFEMSLHPQKATGATGAYKLNIKNTGNADLNISLEGQDPEDLCSFTFDPQRPRVTPGQEIEVAVLVVPGKRPFKGRARAYRLTLTGTPDPGTGDPVSVVAELDATARLPGFVGRIFSPRLRRPSAPNVSRPASRLPRWWGIAAGAAVAVVIVIISLVVVLSGGGGDDFEGGFLINPEKTETYGFDLPNNETARIDVDAEWTKSEDALVIMIQKPDGSLLDSLPISSSGGSVSFLVSPGTSEQDLSGWAIGVTNTSTTEQADGTLWVSFSK
ncbi:MAG: hypothetical protein O2913_05525 [Chloroflexi bacterium]|nr:hypothetical protein [Chloroflexota bacterium]